MTDMDTLPGLIDNERREQITAERRYPALRRLAGRASTANASQVEYEAAQVLAELDRWDRRTKAARREQGITACRFCGHYSPHPCSEPTCSCICRSCGWDAFGAAPDGPCSGPICRTGPDGAGSPEPGETPS